MPSHLYLIIDTSLALLQIVKSTANLLFVCLFKLIASGCVTTSPLTRPAELRSQILHVLLASFTLLQDSYSYSTDQNLL